MSDTYDSDGQDQAEAFDETHTTDDAAEFATFEELPDVFDATAALGDSRDIRALDADEFDEEDLDDEDLEDDEDLDDTVMDELEDVDDETDEEELYEDPDERDGVDVAPADDVQMQFTDDVDRVTDPGDEDVEAYESTNVSDEDLKMLGYPDDEISKTAAPGGARGGGEDADRGTGATADDVEDHGNERQDELLDEGVEETFPASDPVSVKRIT